MANTRPSRRRGQEKDDPRQVRNKADNKMALQATVACVVLLGLVFVMVTFGRGDEPTKKPKPREDPIDYGGVERLARPSEESQVPIILAQEFLIGLGNDERAKIESLIWWDRLFEQKELESKRAEKDRYANLDEDGKQKLRNRFIDMVMDPDYGQLVRDHALRQLVSGTFAWNQKEIGPDYGNVQMDIEDESGKSLLLFNVRTELRPGFHTVDDATNRKAWAIVGIEHEIRNRINDLGQKVRPQKKDYVEELYAADRREEKKQRRKTSAGPPEADPKLVDWLEGTSDSTKSDIEKLCADTVQNRDLRAATAARDNLIDRGKIAIPGVLRAISQMDYEEDRDEVLKSFLLVQVLREITGKKFDYRPETTTMGFGQGGMTRSTPEERRKAIRRWFGWWEANKATWTKKSDEPEPESWEEMLGEDEGEGEGGKNK